jgi:hypothetical protein
MAGIEVDADCALAIADQNIRQAVAVVIRHRGDELLLAIAVAEIVAIFVVELGLRGAGLIEQHIHGVRRIRPLADEQIRPAIVIPIDSTRREEIAPRAFPSEGNFHPLVITRLREGRRHPAAGVGHKQNVAAVIADEEILRPVMPPVVKGYLRNAVWPGPDRLIVSGILGDLRRKDRDHFAVGEFRFGLRPAIDIGANDACGVGGDQVRQAITVDVHEAHRDGHVLTAHFARFGRRISTAAETRQKPGAVHAVPEIVRRRVFLKVAIGDEVPFSLGNSGSQECGHDQQGREEAHMERG